MKTLRPYQADTLNTLKKRLKEVTHPLLVDASVGAGKSLIIAELLLWIERAGWRALCLTMNSTLIKQNAETYRAQGGTCSIYCAGLKEYCLDNPIIFASPHSIVKNLKELKINLIIVDECHNINPHDNNTMYMRILNHFGRLAQENNYSFRVVGLTGTPYREKANSIIGDDQYFKEKVCEISASWLIGQGFLTKPVFGLTNSQSYDYSKLRVNNMGKFNNKEMQSVIDNNERLTSEIMREVQSVVESGRNGAFIFAATRRHCEECASVLPDGQWAIITGETPHDERAIILSKARAGIIRYLINVSCLTTGVDVPLFDVCAWLRPTESLVLYTQGIGRVLRLHEGKQEAIILDYAGNLERHGDIDDPLINEALQPKIKDDPEYCIPCYTCTTLNKVTARRCIGIHDKKRCEHYFEFKPCPKCGIENDIVARHCRGCDFELIDPNAKLKKTEAMIEFDVENANYNLFIDGEGLPIVRAVYLTKEKITIPEVFYTNSAQARNVLYAKFIRNHIKKPSQYYMVMNKPDAMKNMLSEPELQTPYRIVGKWVDNKFRIYKKLFA